ncbi:MAG: OsmC family protein [Myxococcaceae bacterium]
MIIQSQTEQASRFRHVLRAGPHTFHADLVSSSGGEDSAPGPHDYFDASLAACKAMTAMWYAKKNGLALERVETEVERDDSRERQGEYRLKVKLAFFGDLTAAEEQRLYDVAARCPIHKLMTTATIEVETAPLESRRQQKGEAA